MFSRNSTILNQQISFCPDADLNVLMDFVYHGTSYAHVL